MANGCIVTTRFPIDSVQGVKQVSIENVFANFLVVRWQIVTHWFPYVPVNGDDEAFCHLSYVT